MSRLYAREVQLYAHPPEQIMLLVHVGTGEQGAV